MNRMPICALTLSVFAGIPQPAAADTVRIGGTGAALALVSRLGEAFAAAGSTDGVAVVAGLGSGGAINALTAGAIDLAVTARPLTEAERVAGLRAEPLLETPFVFVGSGAPAKTLTPDEIVAVYDGRLTRWPDGTEIKPILRPRSDSASTFLVERIEGMGKAMDSLRRRPDVPVATTDQDNMALAEAVPNSLATATLVQVECERPKVSTVALGGVAPDLEAMRSGRYPWKMRFELVSRAARPAAAARFVAFLSRPEAAAVLRGCGAEPLAAPAAH